MRNSAPPCVFVLVLTISLTNLMFGQQDDRQKVADLSRSLSTQARLGQYDNAIKIATKLLDLRPDEPALHKVRGEMNYMAGKMKSSVADFDRVIELQPQAKPHLWQRGLALYYLGRFDDAAEQFEIHRTVNGQDVENAVWHFACIAQSSSFDEAREQLMEIERDTRVPMMQIHKLFAGSLTAKEVLDVAESGDNPQNVARNKYYANFYLGLYYEAKGDDDKSMEFMKQATSEDNNMPKHALMSQVGNVHLMMRNPKKSTED